MSYRSPAIFFIIILISCLSHAVLGLTHTMREHFFWGE